MHHMTGHEGRDLQRILLENVIGYQAIRFDR